MPGENNRKMPFLEWLVTYVCSPHCRHLEALLISMLVYAVYLVVFTSLGFGWLSISGYLFNKNMETLLVSSPAGLAHVRNMDDLWRFAEGRFLDSLFPGPEEMDSALVVGGPRLRQVKVLEGSCDVHDEARDLQTPCHGHYSASTEDTRPFGPGSSAAWVYSDRGGGRRRGLVATYGGGGYHLDLPANRTDALLALRAAREDGWLTRGTRAVFLDVAVYSANVDKLCIAGLAVEFPPTGGALPSWSFEVVRTAMVSSRLEYYCLLCEVISVIFVTYFLLLEMLKIAHFRLAYFSTLWNLLELSVVVSSAVALAYGISYYVYIYWVMGRLPDSFSVPNLERLASKGRAVKVTTAIALFLAWLKVFYFLRVATNVLAKISVSVSSCVNNSLGFFSGLAIFLLACAQLVHHVLGPHLQEYGTPVMAACSLLRAVLHDLRLDEVRAARPVLGPIVLFAFLALVATLAWSVPLAVFASSHVAAMSQVSRRCNVWDQLRARLRGTTLGGPGAEMLSRFGHLGARHLQDVLGHLEDAQVLPEAAVRRFDGLKQRVDGAERAVAAMADKIRAALGPASSRQ